MGFLKDGLFRQHRGWTLNLRGEKMLAVHCPIHATQLAKALPHGFELQVFEGQGYVSIFSGYLSHFSFFAGIESALHSSCMMAGIPVIQGELRGWYILEAGITDQIVRHHSQRFLNLPLHTEGWSAPILESSANLSLNLPSIEGLSLPKTFQGQLRMTEFNAQPDSLDAFLMSQPNLLWKPHRAALQIGPVYMPPIPLQRAEGRSHSISEGIVAHYLNRWEMIAWRPQSLKLKHVERLS